MACAASDMPSVLLKYILLRLLSGSVQVSEPLDAFNCPSAKVIVSPLAVIDVVVPSLFSTVRYVKSSAIMLMQAAIITNIAANFFIFVLFLVSNGKSKAFLKHGLN